MNNRTVFKIALAMVAAAILHVALFAGLMVIYHPDANHHAGSGQACQDACDQCRDCDTILPRRPAGSLATDFSAGVPGPTVNTNARDELKQQIRRPARQPYCPTCPQVVYPQQTNRYPVIVTPSQPTYVTPSAPRVVTPAAPTIGPGQSQPGQYKPDAPARDNRPTPQPATQPPKYQLALFLDGSAKSRQLRDWFHNDPQLATLRAKCNYQEYTAQNALYQARYRSIVPESQFPAVLFLAPDGGHLHAAGGHMIPGSAEALHADLKEGYRLAQSVKSADGMAEDSGAMRETGYSWDAQINPTMQLGSSSSSPDCVGPDCPLPGSEPQWRPGDRVRDLFDDAKDTRQAVLWAGAQEIAIVALIGLAGFMLIVVVLIIALRRR